MSSCSFEVAVYEPIVFSFYTVIIDSVEGYR
jgi:hypothetical protein